jgi:hypothetical protein
MGKNRGRNGMKRNKRTLVVAQTELTTLTEHILTQMGPEGSAIRNRLQRFYQVRIGRGCSRQEDPVESRA